VPGGRGSVGVRIGVLGVRGGGGGGCFGEGMRDLGI
jgi:hypothetical protein